MNYVTKVVYTLISLSTLAITGAEQHMSTAGKLWSAIGQSKAVTLFRKKIHIPIHNALLAPYLGTVAASAEYQDLCRQAQCDLGIPEEDQVSVKHRVADSPLIPANAYAATADAIYVNENSLRQLPEDIRHTIMLHEAAHVKYNDFSMQLLHNMGFFGVTMTLLGSIHKNAALKKYNGFIMFPVAAAAYTASSITDNTFLQFAERRADTTACYATHCANCVDSYDQHFNKRDAGIYLPHEETKAIARELEKKQTYSCTYHKPL